MELDQISVDPVQGVVTLRGEFDLSNADALRACLDAFDASVAIRMDEVAFIDSTAIGVLVATRNRGVKITIVNPSPRVAKVLEICGLGDVFHLDPA